MYRKWFFEIAPENLRCKYPIMLDIIIHSTEFLKLLANLKMDKASGPDEIKPIVSKELKNVISPVIQIIFEKSLQTGQLPKDWTTSRVSPLLKKSYPESKWKSHSLRTPARFSWEHGRLSPKPQHRVVNRNILRGYEVALKGTENRADTKVGEPVEPGFILSQRQISKLGECHTTLCSFSCNCESNLKPDSLFHGRNPFSPGARVVYILLFWWHANKLDTQFWSCRV